jgi:hypothetical protein
MTKVCRKIDFMTYIFVTKEPTLIFIIYGECDAKRLPYAASGEAGAWQPQN